MKNLKWITVLALGASGGCALEEGSAQGRLDTPGTFYAPGPISAQVQQVIDDSGAGPMFSSSTTRATALSEFRSGYQKLAFFDADITPIAGETKVQLGTREVRLARSTATSETNASMIALWFGSPSGAFLARDAAPETIDVLRTALGDPAGAETSDAVLISQGVGTITATRGGASFAITASGRCPSLTTVSSCLAHLASIAGWTVLQPSTASGGVAVTGVTLFHPIVEMFKAGLDARETQVKTWVAANPTLVDVSLDSPTYKP